MRIYYICEFCERIYNEVEVEGEEGAVEVSGMCEDCAVEMGFTGHAPINRSYYS
jgi:hypothetical protein